MTTLIPNDKRFDASLSLLRKGNCYISETCQQLDTSIFQTRLLLKKTICMKGKEAAELFYDTSRFSRHNAAPGRLQRTLTGKGGVQGLDGDAHQDRKAMIMSLMTSANIKRLQTIFEQQWHKAANTWTQMSQLCLFHAANEVCFKAACDWSGIELSAADIPKRSRQMVTMIESPAAVNSLYLKGILARKSAERWAAGKVREARQQPPVNDATNALQVFAHYKNSQGELFDEHAMAVDLLNIIRPIVAIGRYICFSALALQLYPEWKTRLREGEELQVLNFVHEVRRFYPYFPFAAATVKQDFVWHGYKFEHGTRVLLDLFGTNRDATVWEAPDEFDPTRFERHKPGAFDLVPQGGGNYYDNHRCAGEQITTELMKSAAKWLVRGATYSVPQQDLTVDFTKMPTLPESGFIINQLQLRKSPLTPDNDTKTQGPLNHQEAQSASPAYLSVCGEEDPGAGLEAFVKEQEEKK